MSNLNAKAEGRTVTRESIKRLEELRRDQFYPIIGIVLFGSLALGVLAFSLCLVIAASKQDVVMATLLGGMLGLIVAQFVILTFKSCEGMMRARDEWETFGNVQLHRVYGQDTERTVESERYRVQYMAWDRKPRAEELAALA